MIIVECNPDEFVIRSIIADSDTQIKHGGGKGNVLKKVREEQGTIGVIDEDPHSAQPREMDRYIKEDAKETVRLLKRQDDNAKKLIQLSPDIEGWLINRAKENEISLKDYGLPDDRRRMHDVHHIQKDKDFQRFVGELIQTDDDEVNAIRKWITEAIVDESKCGNIREIMKAGGLND